MKKTYDVFKRLPGGPLWIQAVEGMDEARMLVTFLCSRDAGTYFVYDTSRAEVVAESSSVLSNPAGPARGHCRPPSTRTARGNLC